MYPISSSAPNEVIWNGAQKSSLQVQVILMLSVLKKNIVFNMHTRYQ